MYFKWIDVNGDTYHIHPISWGQRVVGLTYKGQRPTALVVDYEGFEELRGLTPDPVMVRNWLLHLATCLPPKGNIHGA